MKRTKWLCGILVMLMLVVPLYAVGCKKDPAPSGPSGPSAQEPAFTLNTHAVQLSLYDTTTLSVANYEGVTFTSDTPDVASVDASSGLVTALSGGTAIITASKDDKSDTCTVTVRTEGLVPTLEFESVDAKINLQVGDSYEFSPYVRFNEKNYDDFTVTYVSSDSTVIDATTVSGKITALKKGTATVTAKATWRDFGEIDLTKEFTIACASSVVFDLDWSDYDEGSGIYTVASVAGGGVDYQNTVTFAPAVSIDGVDKTDALNVVICSDEDGTPFAAGQAPVKYRDGKLIGVHRGEAYVGVTVDNDGTTERSALHKITVVAPTVQYNADATDRERVYDRTAGIVMNDIIGEVQKAYFTGEDDFTCNTDESTLTVTGLGEAMGEKTLTVETDTIIYTYKCIVATHLISSADDFIAFTKEYLLSDSNSSLAASKKLYGVLKNDIDFANKTITDFANDNYRFGGVFDGMGYTIYTRDKHSGRGFFGNLHDGTIKNFAMIGEKVNQNRYILSGPLYGTSRIENVYVQADRGAICQVGVFWSYSDKAVAENVIVDIKFENSAARLFANNSSLSPQTAMKNVYAISNVEKWYADGEQPKVYTDGGELGADADAMNAIKAFGGYWSVDDDGIKMGGKSLVDTTRLLSMNAPTYYDGQKIDTATFGIGAVQTISIDGTDLTFDAAADVDGTKVTLHLPSGSAALRTVKLVGANGAVAYQCRIATDTISTASELLSFLQSASGEAATKNKTFVLTNDIDCTGNEVLTAGQNATVGATNFYGVFDGCGFAIQNIKITQTTGLFGGLYGDAIIRNLAIFDNLDTALNKFILAGILYQSSTVENVYVASDRRKSTATVGLFNNNDADNCTVRNVIANVQYKNGESSYIYGSNTGTGKVPLTNCYAIGNAGSWYRAGQTDTGAPVDSPVYDTVAEFLTAAGDNITAADGFDMNIWNFREGKLYFGTHEVKDIV